MLKISRDFAAAVRAKPDFDLKDSLNRSRESELMRNMRRYRNCLLDYVKFKYLLVITASLNAMLIASINTLEASPLNCDNLIEWEERAQHGSSETFSDEFLRYAVGSNGFEEIKQALKGTEECEIARYSGGNGKTFGMIRYHLHQYRSLKWRHPDPEENIRIWLSDIERQTEVIQSISTDNDLAGVLFIIASEHKNAADHGPREIYRSSQHVQFEKTIKDKSEEIYRAALARQQAVDERQLADRVETAIAQYGAAVDDLGFPEDYLQANIVLEGPFQNRRWITFREWLAGLYLSGRFESIESSRLMVFGPRGVVLKQATARAHGLYFVLQEKELFLTYVGEVGQLHQVRPQEKLNYGLLLQELIK